MKKVIVFMFLTLFSLISYGNEVDYSGKILIEKLKVLRMIEGLKNTEEQIPMVMANVVGADETLKRVANLDGKLKVDKLILIFPDANEVEKYIEAVSKKVGSVRVVLLNRKVNERYLENRDTDSFIETGGVPKVDKLKNVKFYEVNVADEDLKILFENSLLKSFFEDEINQKYILEIYEMEK